MRRGQRPNYWHRAGAASSRRPGPNCARTRRPAGPTPRRQARRGSPSALARSHDACPSRRTKSLRLSIFRPANLRVEGTLDEADPRTGRDSPGIANLLTNISALVLRERPRQSTFPLPRRNASPRRAIGHIAEYGGRVLGAGAIVLADVLSR